jgi:hypothetical protein
VPRDSLTIATKWGIFVRDGQVVNDGSRQHCRRAGAACGCRMRPACGTGAPPPPAATCHSRCCAGLPCREAVERSLAFLGVDHIDLYYLHRCGWVGGWVGCVGCVGGGGAGGRGRAMEVGGWKGRGEPQGRGTRIRGRPEGVSLLLGWFEREFARHSGSAPPKLTGRTPTHRSRRAWLP